MNLELTVDTGKTTVPIREKDGELIGELTFNPNDFDILKRYEKVVEALEHFDVPEDADGVFAVSDEIKKQIDFLLNYPTSEGIFAKCNPLTLTENGDFYFENVLDGIASIIEQVTNQRVQKKLEKVRKATVKYHKEENE